MFDTASVTILIAVSFTNHVDYPMDRCSVGSKHTDVVQCALQGPSLLFPCAPARLTLYLILVLSSVAVPPLDLRGRAAPLTSEVGNLGTVRTDYLTNPRAIGG